MHQLFELITVKANWAEYVNRRLSIHINSHSSWLCQWHENRKHRNAHWNGEMPTNYRLTVSASKFKEFRKVHIQSGCLSHLEFALTCPGGGSLIIFIIKSLYITIISNILNHNLKYNLTLIWMNIAWRCHWAACNVNMISVLKHLNTTDNDQIMVN